MEQPTIFEEAFGTELLIRSRSLLPVFLKVYIWAGIVISILFFTAVLIGLGFSAAVFRRESMAGWGYGIADMAFLFSGVIFSNTATLWFELKWAIR